MTTDNALVIVFNFHFKGYSIPFLVYNIYWTIILCFLFFRYDVNNDHYLDVMEMKLLMEKLGAPQTHVGLKNMIAEIDEDNDGKVSFREVNFI